MGTASTVAAPLTGLRRLEVIVLLGALTAFAPLSIDMYLPAMPALQQFFKATEGGVQLTLASFFLGYAFGQSLYGPLTDRFGRRPPLYIGLALYVLTSLGCALAYSIHALTWFRLLQSIGACSGPVIARAMVRDLFPPEETRRVYSALILVMGVSPLVAPLVGSYLLIWFDWKAIFYTVAALGAAALFAVHFRVRESLPAAQPLAMGYIASTYRGLMADRYFLGSALATGFSSAGMFAYIAGAPFVFIDLFKLTPQQFGWLFAANASAVVLSAQVNGRAFQGSSPERLMRNAALVQCAAGALLMAAVLAGGLHLLWIAVPLFLYLACIGFVFPNAVAMALANHGRIAGMASALLGTLQFTMAAATVLILGAINNTTAFPMALAILICGALGVATHLALMRGAPEHLAAN